MALPTRTGSSEADTFGTPSGFFGSGTDYELYEEDGNYVLSVELPGFDPAEIDVTWNDGVLNVAAEQDESAPRGPRTTHRRFRFPSAVDDDGITASYSNGILSVTLPVETGGMGGQEIEIEAS